MTIPHLHGNDDQLVLCGGCGKRIANVELGAHLSTERAPRLLRFWGGGWRLGPAGAWQIHPRAKKAVGSLHPPRSRHPGHRATADGPAVDLISSPRSLPAAIECPWPACGAINTFDLVGPCRLDGVYAPRESDDELPDKAFLRR